MRWPMRHWVQCLCVAFAVLGLFACREEEMILVAEPETVLGLRADAEAVPQGFYLLNEGNMGSNKATLDYLDFRTGQYLRNWYGERNPTVVKELGDVGNDIQIYGNRLYVVLNCSHKVEVMDARTGVRIGQVEIPSPRYVAFHEGYAYVSAYVGTIGQAAQAGSVFRVDTASLSVTGEVTVGRQPEEVAIRGEYLYVANSGGYDVVNYDRTVSVVDLRTFRQVSRVDVAPNLHRLKADQYGELWATARNGKLYVLTPTPRTPYLAVSDSVDVVSSCIALRGDSLFAIGVGQAVRVIDVRSRGVLSQDFLHDPLHRVTNAYGLALHPENGDIYLMDAGNYVSSGKLYCYSSAGVYRWSVRTGDIPAHVCFLYP